MRHRRPVIPVLALAAALTAGCVVAPTAQPAAPALPAPVAPSLAPTSPGASGAPAATPADAAASYVAVFTLGLRTADAGIQVYNRLNAKATAARLALLQADGEADADADPADDEGDEDAAADEDEDADEEEDDEQDFEAYLDEEWDDEEFDDWLASLDEEEWIDVDEDEVVEVIEDWDFEDLDGEEGGDRRLKQRIAVEEDGLAGDTGEVVVDEIVDPAGHVREGTLTYVPDPEADANGLAPQTIKYDVPAAHEGTGNQVDVTVEGKEGEAVTGAGQVLKWGATTATFTEKVLPSGAVVLAGTVKTDTGLTLDLAGEARPDGARDFTVTGGGYAIVFKDVKDLSTAQGFVLDKAPDAADAKVVSTIAANPAGPTTFQALAAPLPYAEARAKMARGEFAAIKYGLSCNEAAGPVVADLAIEIGRAADALSVASRMTVDAAGVRHAVAVEGLDASVMSDEADRYRSTDLATGTGLVVALDQESASFELGEGAGAIAVEERADGSFAVAGRIAPTARLAGEALARTRAGASVPVHALAGLRATLAALPAEATRSTCPHHGTYRLAYYCPPIVEKSYMPGYRVVAQAEVLDGWLAARQGR